MTGRSNAQEDLAKAGSVVRESIRRTLKDLIGEQGAQSSFVHVGLADYEKATKEYHVRLFAIFQKGSETIERLIIKDLYETLNIPLQDSAVFDYKKSVKHALKVAHERIIQERRTHYVP